MSARAVWKGDLSIGFVNIKIAAYKAIDAPNSGLEAKLLHATCKTPISQPRRCNKCDVALATADIVKGYDDGQKGYVLITDAELEAIKPESSHLIKVDRFVKASEVDLLHYDVPYFIGPDGATDGYATMRDAMRRTAMVAIGQVTMYGHEFLVAIRPNGNGLVMQRLRENSEIRSFDTIKGSEDIPATSDAKHLKFAEAIIENMAEEFDDSHEDACRKELAAIIKRKIAGEEAPAAVAVVEQKPMTDFLAALEQSAKLKHVKKPKPVKVAEVAPVKAKKTKKAA
jgi:DNA end-binding protein Ku